MKKNKKYDLEERTLSFAKKTFFLCRKLQSGVVDRVIVYQLTKASGSVGANYREADEALSKKDFTYRIKLCRKEAKESAYWLDILADGHAEKHEEILELFGEATELMKIFSCIASKSR